MPTQDTDHNELLRSLNVLVVDDIPAVRNILSNILRALGVEGRIDMAGDGLEAWVLIQTCDYDLVICDIRMPRMNGLELKKVLRATPRFADLPFLVISGEVSEDIMAAAVTSEWDGYLQKPFSTAKLKKKLLPLLWRVNNTEK